MSSNEEIIKQAIPDYAQYSETMSRSEIEVLLNEARADESSQIELCLKKYLIEKNYPKGIMDGILNSIKERK